MSQRIALRGLFGKLGVSTRSGEEEKRAPEFFEELAELRGRAGGQAPLPPAPDSTPIDELTRLAGSEQLAALHGRKKDVEQWIESWSVLADRAAARIPAWERVAVFRRHAECLPIAEEVAPEINAIDQQRSLLAETDQVGPLVAKLAGALREALVVRHAELTNAVAAACTTLAGDATWSKLDEAAQQQIRNAVRLTEPLPLVVATDDDLLRALDVRSLEAWRSEIDAVDTRVGQALQEAAKMIDASMPPDKGGLTDRPVPPPPPPRTTTVHVRRGTLPTKRPCESGCRSRRRTCWPQFGKGR